MHPEAQADIEAIDLLSFYEIPFSAFYEKENRIEDVVSESD